MRGMGQKGAVKIRQEDIVEAALTLVDEQGLGALNMRAIAARLGVQASALYWHFPSKTVLMRAMAQSFHARALVAAGAGAAKDWRRWLRDYGAALRGALLSHQGSALLCATARPAPDTAAAAADILSAPLVAQGLSRARALSCLASINALVLGWAVYEQSEAMHDHLAEMIGFDESFALGLEAMVAGFRVD